MSNKIEETDEIEALIWFDDIVNQAKKQVLSFDDMLTPARAKVLLERNPDNRSKSFQKIDDFIRDIKAGAWQLNGEPLIISIEGLLNDGQNRCEAVLKSGISIKTAFTFGRERNTRVSVDQGKNRTTANYLSMEGHKDSSNLSSLANFVWQIRKYKRIRIASNFRPTKNEVLNFVDETPSLAISLLEVPYKNSDLVGGRATLAAAHWMITQKYDIEQATQFTDRFINGSGFDIDDTVLTIRNTIMREKGNYSPHYKINLILRAFKAYRLNEKVKYVRNLKDDSFIEI